MVQCENKFLEYCMLLMWIIASHLDKKCACRSSERRVRRHFLRDGDVLRKAGNLGDVPRHHFTSYFLNEGNPSVQHHWCMFKNNSLMKLDHILPDLLHLIDL